MFGQKGIFSTKIDVLGPKSEYPLVAHLKKTKPLQVAGYNPYNKETYIMQLRSSLQFMLSDGSEFSLS